VKNFTILWLLKTFVIFRAANFSLKTEIVRSRKNSEKNVSQRLAKLNTVIGVRAGSRKIIIPKYKVLILHH